MKKKLFGLFLMICLVGSSSLSAFATRWQSNDSLALMSSREGSPTAQILRLETTRPDRHIIDGGVKPELIPDEVAYSLLFRVVSNAQSADARIRIRHYIRRLGLGNQAGNRCSVEEGSSAETNDDDIDAFIAVADDFRRRVSVLDQQAIQIKRLKLAKMTDEMRMRLVRLQQQKEEIVAELVGILPRRLTSSGAENIRMHVNEGMKRRIRISHPSAQLESNTAEYSDAYTIDSPPNSKSCGCRCFGE